MKQIQSRPISFGKAFEQFTKFIAACKTGKRIIYHGIDYVAMDRKSYEALIRKTNNPAEVIEKQIKSE